jgi:hypothetical protein
MHNQRQCDHIDLSGRFSNVTLLGTKIHQKAGKYLSGAPYKGHCQFFGASNCASQPAGGIDGLKLALGN